MFESLGQVVLRSGETVEAAVLTGPDDEWALRIRPLLGHKGGIWNWQIARLLESDVGIEARFHLLHREGEPFCHILTATVDGVGLLGHVYTLESERGQGAASALMSLVTKNFEERGGRALYLGTGYGTSPYRIYQSHGFASIEPRSGTMEFYTENRDDFYADYFAPGPCEIVPLNWRHWAAGSALFCGDFGDPVRCPALGLLGRCLTESRLLAPLAAVETDEGATLAGRMSTGCEPDRCRAIALQKRDNGALVGIAGWSQSHTWPKTAAVDVYCHPEFTEHSPRLLAALPFPATRNLLAYSGAEDKAQGRFWQEAGFQRRATLPAWLPRDSAGSSADADVILWTRSG